MADTSVDTGPRRCASAVCSKLLPPDAGPRRRYCSPACRQEAHHARHRYADPTSEQTRHRRAWASRRAEVADAAATLRLPLSDLTTRMTRMTSDTDGRRGAMTAAAAEVLAAPRERRPQPEPESEAQTGGGHGGGWDDTDACLWRDEGRWGLTGLDGDIEAPEFGCSATACAPATPPGAQAAAAAAITAITGRAVTGWDRDAWARSVYGPASW
ncbi:hypothetical protein [Actinomadura harenae]|uniref:Uncharacterized protein n=1 Tax=Actinomadura harenae TaxID=2483351 RepID=A0A3M2M140_9ACTN|nr:hypothetical protein [Actinomadura harenae]RMI43341.1 hypothetical protein EBO15_16840 [Actinomadura harenae]